VSIDRQYGLHELPGTEEPAPAPRREAVSAGFEAQMRGYVNAIWAKIAELEAKIDGMSSQPRPLLVTGGGGEARGERYGDEPGSTMVGVRAVPPKPALKPWEAEGVSKATWYRRQGKGA
jgi:hypothetical protein